MEQPEIFDGIVSIRWASPPRPDRVMAGWQCSVILDGKMMPGVTGLDVHVGVDCPVWAEVTSFIAERGGPIKNFDALWLDQDGEPHQLTFAYLVSEMQIGN